MKELSEEEHNKIDPDAALVRDSPCFCGRKSVARMRIYSDKEMHLFAVCHDHIKVLVKMAEDMI